jgi:phosphate transport system substrate-binding protein
MPLVQELSKAYEARHGGGAFQFDAGTNSGGAIRGVVDGTLDVAVVNRPLKEEEATQGVKYHPFAKDAIVFAVHAPDGATRLSTNQVRSIYAGTVSDWSALGGRPGPIVVLDRDEDESARKLVLVPLLGGQPVKARTTVLAKASEMTDALQATPNAIGYSSLGLLRLRGTENVQTVALDGVEANIGSIQDSSYPWHLTFGLVVKADGSPELARFVQFVNSPEARPVLERFGYASVSP